MHPHPGFFLHLQTRIHQYPDFPATTGRRLKSPYRHVPIDYDGYLDVLFLYWVEDPTAYEHDDLFYILGISQLLMIYIYMLFVFVLGMDA